MSLAFLPASDDQPPPATLDDGELVRRTAMAFDAYKKALALSSVDSRLLNELVELQSEYLRRFPGQDLPQVTSLDSV
jgi:DNA primase large subunit